MASRSTMTPDEPDASCAICGRRLNPAARFCHTCGTPVGPGQRRPATAQPLYAWAVAVLAVIAVAGLMAGRSLARPPAPAPATTAGGAPDVSAMTPEERADRLFNRVMTYAMDGKPESAAYFAPMAVGAFRSLAPLTHHQRYDLGLIGIVTGDGTLAAEEAAAILRTEPAHLLGLALAASAADARRDTAAYRTYNERLLAAEPAERARALPEYTDHAAQIDAAVATARMQRGAARE